MLNNDEIETSVQVESDPVDDEADEDEANNNHESSKDTAMEWYEQQSVLSHSTTAAQENQRRFSEKTKVYNGTAKNMWLFSTIKCKYYTEVKSPVLKEYMQ
ncbi:UNVERIFIED_CONTAM: hypothetical protein NCL1_50777 [Trichonephila clavipes]